MLSADSCPIFRAVSERKHVMEAPAWPMATELAEAFELWQSACCPQAVADEYLLGEEEGLRCHASCL